jgi:hypothetical protein
MCALASHVRPASGRGAHEVAGAHGASLAGRACAGRGSDSRIYGSLLNSRRKLGLDIDRVRRIDSKETYAVLDCCKRKKKH